MHTHDPQNLLHKRDFLELFHLFSRHLVGEILNSDFKNTDRAGALYAERALLVKVEITLNTNP